MRWIKRNVPLWESAQEICTNHEKMDNILMTLSKCHCYYCCCNNMCKIHNGHKKNPFCQVTHMGSSRTENWGGKIQWHCTFIEYTSRFY